MQMSLPQNKASKKTSEYDQHTETGSAKGTKVKKATAAGAIVHGTFKGGNQ